MGATTLKKEQEMQKEHLQFTGIEQKEPSTFIADRTGEARIILKKFVQQLRPIVEQIETKEARLKENLENLPVLLEILSESAGAVDLCLQYIVQSQSTLLRDFSDNQIAKTVLKLIDDTFVELWKSFSDFSQDIFSPHSEVFKQKLKGILNRFSLVLKKEDWQQVSDVYTVLENYSHLSLKYIREKLCEYKDKSLTTDGLDELRNYLKNIGLLLDYSHRMRKKYFHKTKKIDIRFHSFLIFLQYEAMKANVYIEMLLQNEFTVIPFGEHFSVSPFAIIQVPFGESSLGENKEGGQNYNQLKVKKTIDSNSMEFKIDPYVEDFNQFLYDLENIILFDFDPLVVEEIFINLQSQMELLCQQTHQEIVRISKLSANDPELLYSKKIYLSLAKLYSWSLICYCVDELIEDTWKIKIAEIKKCDEYASFQYGLIKRAVNLKKEEYAKRNFNFSPVILETKAETAEMEMEEETNLIELIRLGDFDLHTISLMQATFMSLPVLELSPLCLEIKNAGNEFIDGLKIQLQSLSAEDDKQAGKEIIDKFNEFKNFCQELDVEYQKRQPSILRVDETSIFALQENCNQLEAEVNLFLKKKSDPVLQTYSNRHILMPTPSSSSSSSASNESSSASSSCFQK